jgi:CRISPR-associated protein Csd1
MILQALAAYYDQLLADGAVQPQGFQEKEIAWVVELSPSGRFLALRRTGGEDGRGRKFVVPAEVKKSVNIAANLLWDNPEYVFGWPRSGLTEKQAEKVPQRHESFMERLRELPESAREDAGVSAVIKFLERGDFADLQSAEGWEELRQGNPNLSFRLDGDNCLVCERPGVRSALSRIPPEPGEQESGGWCLITGRRGGSARLHPSIKGVRGAQTSGANLVSFNLEAFTSHGWTQGANAPVSSAAAHAYTAALNHLLARGNERHRLVEGDTTFVFWAAATAPIEDQFAHLLGSYAAAQQESDGTPVRETLEGARRGLRPSLDDQTPFYVLGLAPNAARLAVRYWHEGTVAELAHNILRHFDDLEVSGLGGESNLPSVWRLMAAAARNGDSRKLQDNLRGQLVVGLMTSILDGLPYPATLLARTLGRCRAEQSVWPIRAAVIKAALNRRSPAKEVTVSLDPDEPNPGYRLGRLFAVVESIQRSAQGDINVTIRDRYFSSAMTAPRSAFAELMRLKNAHLKKVRRSNTGLAVHFERLLDQILAELPAAQGFPASLSLDDQGRFILGYHHQRNLRSGSKAEYPPASPTELPERQAAEQGD